MVVREILKTVLESDPDIRVVGMAADGGEAVELTAQLKPDLVTMDLVMPGHGRHSRPPRASWRYHPTPVLFFSSYFDQEGMHSRLDALAAGALDVVEKPTLVPDEQWDGAWPARSRGKSRRWRRCRSSHISAAAPGTRSAADAAGPGPRGPGGRGRRRDRRLVGRPARAGRAALGTAGRPTLWPSSWSSTWPRVS